MKFKPLGVFQVYQHKMCAKLGLACMFASWLLGRCSEAEQMQMPLQSHRGMGCRAHMCDLLLFCLLLASCAPTS